MASLDCGLELTSHWWSASRFVPVATALFGLIAGLAATGFGASSLDGSVRTPSVAVESAILTPVPLAYSGRTVVTSTLTATGNSVELDLLDFQTSSISDIAGLSALVAQDVQKVSIESLIPEPDPAAADATLMVDRVSIERPLSTLSPHAVDILLSRNGNVSVAVFDFRDGTAYYFGKEKRYELFSVAKITILLTFLERARMGLRDLSDYDQLQLRNMITSSDNLAATNLWARSGKASGVGGIINRIGLGGSHINVVDGDWGGMTATAMDAALLLAEVSDGRVISEASRSYALMLLEEIREDQSWGVSAGLLSHGRFGDHIALKNGWWFDVESLDWIVHSVAAVIDANNNSRYTVAIMSDSQPTYDYGITTIEDVARAIHSSLAPDSISSFHELFES